MHHQYADPTLHGSCRHSRAQVMLAALSKQGMLASSKTSCVVTIHHPEQVAQHPLYLLVGMGICKAATSWATPVWSPSGPAQCSAQACGQTAGR